MASTRYIRALPKLDTQYQHELDVMLRHDAPKGRIDRFLEHVADMTAEIAALELEHGEIMTTAIKELETLLAPLETRARALWDRYSLDFLP